MVLPDSYVDRLTEMVQRAEANAERESHEPYHPLHCGPCDEQCAARLRKVRRG